MRIQWKVIILVLLVLIGALSAVVWKTQSLILEDKIDFITESNIKQMAPLRKLIDARLDDGKNRLVEFAARRATGAIKASQFGEFDVVSLVQPGESGQWIPSWIEKGPEAKGERWPQGYDVTLLKSLPFAKVRDGEVLWTRLSDTQGSPIFALMVSVEVQTPGAPAPAEGASGQLPETTDYGALAPAGSGHKAVVVGFAAANPLAVVAEDSIGSMNTVYVVDDKGYIASHTNRSYLGSLFSEDPIVREIMKGQKSAGSGQFDDLESRPVIGHFERIEKSNVYAVITTPLQAATGLVEAYSRVALVTGASVGVLGLLLAWLIGRNMSNQLQRTISAVQEINRGESIAALQPLHTNDEIGVLTQQLSEAFRKLAGGGASAAKAQASEEGASGGDGTSQAASAGDAKDEDDPFAEIIELTRSVNTPQPKEDGSAPSADRLASERRVAYEAFSEGLEESVKEPLLAIIGHAQLVRTKSENTEVKSHADSIEREARRAREVLERLRDFDREPEALAESDRMNLEQVVRAAIARESSALGAESVDVILDLKPVPMIKGHVPQMEAVIANVIENAREAMVNRPARKLMVTLKDEGEQLRLEIADTGVGMSRDVKDRAFDPFFKAFENPRRMGLGLSFLQAAIKRIGATAEIESSPGEGTRFKLRFKVTPEDRKAFEAEPNVVAAFVESARASEEEPGSVLAQSKSETSAVSALPPGMPPLVRPKEHEPEPAQEARPEPVNLAGKVAPAVEFPPAPPPEPKREYAPEKKVETWAPKAESSDTQNQSLGALKDLRLSQNLDLIEDETDEASSPKADVTDNDFELSFSAIPIGDVVQKPKVPPPGASSRRSLESDDLDDEDEDEDEPFANVALNRAIGDLRAAAPPPPPPSRPPSAPPASMEASAESTASSGGEFKVKIRRPKAARGTKN